MASAPQLEGGTYEIIRNRMLAQAADLRTRLAQLNESRKTVFGAIDYALTGSDRIGTDNNCVARDIVAIGNRTLFGYNVHIGLRAESKLTDVFSLYRYEGKHFVAEPLDLISDPRFVEEYKNLFKYYRDTVFVRFVVLGVHLYMVFKIGKADNDIKAFKWLISPDDTLKYLDGRSDAEIKMPDQWEFRWVRATREMHRKGKSPHISILDRIFVETIGGTLTIKVEDNTDTGQGIYEEEVLEKEQGLDDAEIFYADLGNIIVLKIKPFQEKEYRYIAFNQKMQEARRIDAIGNSCVRLPEDHGIIFANGYYLQTGEFKQFEGGESQMQFERRIPSPNGEDHLFVFYNQRSGNKVLLSYNIIAQQVETPILCHGYTLFEDGELIFFKHEEEPRKNHAIQIWQTPYTAADYQVEGLKDNFLFKVGNRDIVRAMAQCQEVLILLGKNDTYSGLYYDLTKLTGDLLDGYYWLGREEAHKVNEPLIELRKGAESAIQEFDKVLRMRKHTQGESQRVQAGVAELIRTIKRSIFEDIYQFVTQLGALRTWRGEVTTLKELRYVEVALVDQLDKEISDESARLSQQCVEFLLRDDALKPYAAKIETQRVEIPKARTAIEAAAVEKQVEQTASELEMLIEIVSNLKIADATQTTRIIDQISAIFAELNQVRAALRRHRKELMGTEAVAEFAAQLKLLEQAVANYLDISDSPDKCSEYLTKLMVQVEELEGKFGEYDQFVTQLTDKREEVYNAFEAKRLQLIEQRNQRASSLFKSAERILAGIKTRVSTFTDPKEINGYFASDLMIEKLREVVIQLQAMDDTVKAEDLQSRMKVIREDALRQLRDKQELFVDGENVIQLGKHRFSVNVQPLDLTIVQRDDAQYFHLTGTNFFERIESDELEGTRSVWNMTIVSENPEVYRSEFLAHAFFQSLAQGPDRQAITAFAQLKPEAQMDALQKFAAPRFQEGYAKGVHDHDALLILQALVLLHANIELLRFLPEERACACLWWHAFVPTEQQQVYERRIKGMGFIMKAFPDSSDFGQLKDELARDISAYCAETKLFSPELAPRAADYLFQEVAQGDQFVASPEAQQIATGLLKHLKDKGLDKSYRASLQQLEATRRGRFELLRAWLQAYVREAAVPDGHDYVEEAAMLLFAADDKRVRGLSVSVKTQVKGLRGEHAVIGEGGVYALDYNHFMHKLGKYCAEVVPLYERFSALKKQLSEQCRHDMRLEEFKPRVLSSFVRNKLIDEVYLPLFGDNLAKQIGGVGENKRTDRQGMLLLISPPGYGKTTLMEYISNRLGLIFMKINGPAIGHDVTSLDPVQAPNTAAREEINKLNLALEMGDNIMLYVDDIQHCNPEFLQKFISLCDAQRKIEGVYKGRPRTYDLRGKRVCVVMAGNPYTESGQKFKIPDMLSNRADTYNLGDIIGDTAHFFRLSLIENALSSNGSLQKVAQRNYKDIYGFLQIAETDNREGVALDGNYGAEEVTEVVTVLKKLLIVRDILLKVNEEYIRSAGMSDDFRTEPAFKLQGSYRDMNKLAEKVIPIMNDNELLVLIKSHYQSESQTLTTGAESNLLKFKELCGLMSGEERVRWDEIKATFMKKQRLMGLDSGDKFSQAIVALNELVEAVRGNGGKVK